MRLRGVDVSSWQHPGGAAIDWSSVYDAGYRFAIVKATQGVDYVNPWFGRDHEDAYAAGLMVGAYHFYATGVDAAAQAHYFTAAVMGKRLECYAWLDYEVAFGTPYEASADVGAFLDAAKDARPDCGLYADGYTVGALRTAGGRLPKLWIADPGAAEPPQGAWAWQSAWGVDVPGIAGGADVDVIVSTRGLNLPTEPKPRAVAADVAAAVAAAKADEEAALASPDPEAPDAAHEAAEVSGGH
ncbi:MAG: glycoside hydrolase family 25 protein [Acidimicrobiales bacterium]